MRCANTCHHPQSMTLSNPGFLAAHRHETGRAINRVHPPHHAMGTGSGLTVFVAQDDVVRESRMQTIPYQGCDFYVDIRDPILRTLGQNDQTVTVQNLAVCDGARLSGDLFRQRPAAIQAQPGIGRPCHLPTPRSGAFTASAPAAFHASTKARSDACKLFMSPLFSIFPSASPISCRLS